MVDASEDEVRRDVDDGTCAQDGPWTDPVGFTACFAFLAYEYWTSRGSRLTPMKQAAE